MNKVSMSCLASFSRYQTKCYEVLISTADDVMNFNIFLGSSSTAMADRKKRGEDQNTKIRISRERKELFR